MRYSVRVLPGVRVYGGRRGPQRSVGLRLLILVILAIAFFQSLFAAHFMAAFGMVKSSSAGENGMGTFMAPMRFTGASR